MFFFNVKQHGIHEECVFNFPFDGGN